VLPQQFIEMDMDFHKSAGMLAHAAEMKNADVVNFYFYKMNAACVSCHGKYATERFPGLIKGGDEEHHH
jgi:cytochrome c556